VARAASASDLVSGSRECSNDVAELAAQPWQFLGIEGTASKLGVPYSGERKAWNMRQRMANLFTESIVGFVHRGSMSELYFHIVRIRPNVDLKVWSGFLCLSDAPDRITSALQIRPNPDFECRGRILGASLT
jgi:hypothetical protein